MNSVIFILPLTLLQINCETPTSAQLSGSFVRQSLLNNYPVVTHSSVTPIPEQFDARTQWPGCYSINTVADQGLCNSSWAYSAVYSMSDRICVATNGTNDVDLSTEALIDCCTDCYLGSGCSGGWTELAWDYWVRHGLPTKECKPYIQNDPVSVKCLEVCESNYPREWKDDLVYGSEMYKLASSIQNVQLDIMTNGPLALSFDLYDDLEAYTEGVYVHADTATLIGTQVVRVLGWGMDDGTPYWLLANTWGSGWGEKGCFKIRRGTNECNIEDFRKLYVAKYEEPSNSTESLMYNKCLIIFAIVYLLNKLFI